MVFLFGPLVAAGIAAGSQLFSSIGNSLFARKAYEKQRKDALADWNRQNAYNSPQQQMQRFKEAGLNPHLIYGQGSPGQAAAMQSPNVPPAEVPDIGSTGLFAYQQAQQQNIQTSNLARLEEESQKRLDLIDSQIASNIAGTEGKNLSNEKAKATFEYYMEAIKLRNEKLKGEINIQDQRYILNLSKEQRDDLNSKHRRDMDILKYAEGIRVANMKNARTKEQNQIARERLKETQRNGELDRKIKSLNYQQKLYLDKFIKEDAAIQSAMLQSKREDQLNTIDNRIKENKLKFNELGLSETFVSDMIKLVLGVVGIEGGAVKPPVKKKLSRDTSTWTQPSKGGGYNLK